MALNAKLGMNNDYERQTKKVVALMLKWKGGSKRQTEYVALNAKIKKDSVIKCQNENIALNAKLKRGSGFERWT